MRAPVRVLDAGGWTDTWFARYGSVCHLAVEPGAEVVARKRPLGAGGGEAGSVQLHLPSFNDHYQFPLDEAPGRHPMLEAALRHWAPRQCQLDVTVSSPVPPGSGLGTSASVVVALIGALQRLDGAESGPGRVAQCAHEIETVDLGLQSGVQDQVAAAFGGANFVTIAPYPRFEVRPVEVEPGTWDALCRRAITVYLGKRHDSSAIHTSVIERLSGNGASAKASTRANAKATAKANLQEAPGGFFAGDAHNEAVNADGLMAPLRAAAEQAATALANGDLDAYGEAMVHNTEAQAALHPALVSPMAQQVIDIARQHGAAGWKVNGAGGYGGTVSVLGPEDPEALKRALSAVTALTLLPLQPSTDGVKVVDQD